MFRLYNAVIWSDVSLITFETGSVNSSCSWIQTPADTDGIPSYKIKTPSPVKKTMLIPYLSIDNHSENNFAWQHFISHVFSVSCLELDDARFAKNKSLLIQSVKLNEKKVWNCSFIRKVHSHIESFQVVSHFENRIQWDRKQKELTNFMK